MLEISEADIRDSLARDNPWWREARPASIETLTKRRSYFHAFAEIVQAWSVKRAIILLGPRRVGKTVMLMQFVDDLIVNGFPASHILFASLDTPIYSGMPLEKIITLFERHTSHDPEARRLVIFDEIQYLKDWEQHLKVLIDRHPNTRFIASGSAAAALRLKSQESGAGRFTDFLLPPLTFAEFLDFSDLEETLIEGKETGRTLRFSSPDIQRLNSEFINYLNYGGYPEAVFDSAIRANTQRYLGRDIVDRVLLRDLPSLYGIQDIQELNRLFTTIAYHSGQEISLEGLATSSGVAKNTIARYLEYLEAAFLIIRVRRVDDTGRTFQRMRHFKAYLTNPSMRAALFAPLTATDNAIGAMAETAVFSQWFHSPELKNLYYARWKSGRQTREVDLVKVEPNTLKPSWAYEVKWSDGYTERSGELSGLVEFAQRNHSLMPVVGASTLTKTFETQVGDITIRHFPCALHCYQVGKNLIEGRPV